LLNAGIVNVAIDLKKTPTDIAKLSGYLLLVTGAAGPFVSALGRKYGKRPVYVASSLIGTIGLIVAETATGYGALLAGRVIQGIAVAAYEALPVATIGDLFFVHERGPRVAILIFFLSAIANGVSIIAGVITLNLGWHYNFHLCMPFALLQLIMVIVYAPETMYRRKHIYETDEAGSETDLNKLAIHEHRVQEKHNHEMGHETKGQPNVEVERTMTRQTTVESIPPKKTFMQEMALYNGSFVNDPLWKMVLACPAIMLNLGALYQILSTGIIIAWFVAVAITTGVIFASPPYLMNSAAIGYMSAGPLIGALLASLTCFFTASPYIKFMSRRNKGIYEPEFCLIPLSLGCVCTVAGLLGWGYAVQGHGSVYLVCFLWALMLFGMTIIATFATQWALDAYRAYSTELFIMNMVFKNFFFYG